MGAVHEIQISRGEDIKEKIDEFLQRQGWEGAYISGAIGSVRDVVFSAPASVGCPPEIEFITCNMAGELLSFTGEVIPEEQMDAALQRIYDVKGKYFIHIHASVAVAGGHVYGGGFQSGHVLRAVKVYIQEVPGNGE